MVLKGTIPCSDGGIGRHEGSKSPWPVTAVWVRVPLGVLENISFYHSCFGGSPLMGFPPYFFSGVYYSTLTTIHVLVLNNIYYIIYYNIIILNSTIFYFKIILLNNIRYYYIKV